MYYSDPEFLKVPSGHIPEIGSIEYIRMEYAHPTRKIEKIIVLDARALQYDYETNVIYRALSKYIPLQEAVVFATVSDSDCVFWERVGCTEEIALVDKELEEIDTSFTLFVDDLWTTYLNDIISEERKATGSYTVHYCQQGIWISLLG